MLLLVQCWWMGKSIHLTGACQIPWPGRPKDPPVWFWRVVMYESAGWFLSPGANMLIIADDICSTLFQRCSLCKRKIGRWGGGGVVAKGKGEVMRYVDVLGGKQLPPFKAKPSLMEGASGKEGRKCIWSNSPSRTQSFGSSHSSLSPIHRIRLE